MFNKQTVTENTCVYIVVYIKLLYLVLVVNVNIYRVNNNAFVLLYLNVFK